MFLRHWLKIQRYSTACAAILSFSGNKVPGVWLVRCKKQGTGTLMDSHFQNKNRYIRHSRSLCLAVWFITPFIAKLNHSEFLEVLFLHSAAWRERAKIAAFEICRPLASFFTTLQLIIQFVKQLLNLIIHYRKLTTRSFCHNTENHCQGIRHVTDAHRKSQVFPIKLPSLWTFFNF